MSKSKKSIIYKASIRKLDKIERELKKMIEKTDNGKLLEKYLDWEDQRIRCNEAYISALEEVINSL